MKTKIKIHVFQSLYVLAVSLMIAGACLGVYIGIAVSPVCGLVSMIGLALVWLPMVFDFDDLYEKARQELEEENRPYRFR